MTAVFIGMFYFAILIILGIIYGSFTLYYIVAELIEYVKYRREK